MILRRGKKILFWAVCVILVAILTCVLLIALSRGPASREISASHPVEIEHPEDEKKLEELFADYYGAAEDLLATMTLEEKVGQIFLARAPKTMSETLSEISLYQPGGYILFGVNFRNETPSSIQEKLRSYQGQSKLRLILGVDEEGGSVVRVSNYRAFRAQKFPSPQELFAIGGMDEILRDVDEKSELLRSLDINMNLAPVADVPISKTAFMYARSFGQNAEQTADYVARVVAQMNQDGIISVMKHFPGYGDNVDTHTGVAIDSRGLDDFRNYDFLPFMAGIEANGPAILVNHNIIQAMDGEYPASLSPEVHRVLREDLKFSGIIMTDDLAMAAVKSYVNNGNVATKAFLAGNDIIITSNLAEHYQEILTSIQQGVITEDMVDTAVRRILAMKLRYSIIE